MTALAVLLNGPVRHDSRVIRIVRALSAHGGVDLFYTNGGPDDGSLFGPEVRLFPVDHRETTWRRVVRHSLFHLEYGFLADAAAATGRRYDIVYANDLPTLEPAVRLKRRNRARVIYDSHEIYVETLNQFFPERAPALKRAVFAAVLAGMRVAGRRAERRLVREADVVLTVNRSLAGYFESRYALRDVRVVMNTPAYEAEPAAASVDFRRMFGWADGDRIFLYQGTINRGRAFQVLLPAIHRVLSQVKLVFVGDGSLRPALESEVQRLGLQERVKFVGRVAPEILPGYTAAADLGVDLVDLNLSKELSASNKFFEYLHAGLPSLCTDTIEHRRVFDRYEVGVLVRNEIEHVARGILELMNSPDLVAMRSACRAAAKEYNWQAQSVVLDEIVRSLMSEAPRGAAD